MKQGGREASGRYTRSRRLSNVSEPPRIAHEEQDLGEIARADRAAGPDHLSGRQALGHADRRAERKRAVASLERHAGIDEHDVAGSPEAVALADEVVIGDAVNAATEADRYTVFGE